MGKNVSKQIEKLAQNADAVTELDFRDKGISELYVDYIIIISCIGSYISSVDNCNYTNR